jgi:hypothetical protein
MEGFKHKEDIPSRPSSAFRIQGQIISFRARSTSTVKTPLSSYQVEHRAACVRVASHWYWYVWLFSWEVLKGQASVRFCRKMHTEAAAAYLKLAIFRCSVASLLTGACYTAEVQTVRKVPQHRLRLRRVHRSSMLQSWPDSTRGHVLRSHGGL